MELVNCITALYNILPLDATLRKGKLPAIIQQYPKEVACILAVADTPPKPQKDYLLTEPTEDAIRYELLGKQDYHLSVFIVLKAMATRKFNLTVLLEYLPKVYSKSQAHKLLQPEKELVQTVDYVIGHVHYTYRSLGARVHSSIWRKAERPPVDKGTCLLTVGNNVVAIGDKQLYKYALGKHIKPPTVEFIGVRTTTEEKLHNVFERYRGSTISIFREHSIEVRELPAYVAEVTPMDWIVDDNYQPVGYVLEVNGKIQKIKAKVHKRALAVGLENIKVKLSYGVKGDNLIKLKVLDVSYEAPDG